MTKSRNKVDKKNQKINKKLALNRKETKELHEKMQIITNVSNVEKIFKSVIAVI